ncbi:UbiA family prenyltransferase [Mycolicibacterium iranicum]|uniref:Ubiquinone biosynthesis protein UbiA n=1 Tax=Mycolicibacterium iranicum TaxID=912594 RepID=A0A1X1WCL7_MYCIR|nr:UbiA family prenyltransferase [Mycolicibacterium iranicum]ORV84242.1 ubiquinone biosynthesis protein UbiA [Mycolicibacterium iranicum]
MTVPTQTPAHVLTRARALLAAGHPGPSQAISVLATVLAAQAAPDGIGPALTGPAMLAGQLSIGWSNDAVDAARDAAAGRTDKPVAAGVIGVRPVWIAAYAALLAALAMALAISPLTALILTVIVGAAWAYNLGLKSTPASGLMYILGFGPIPAYAASTLPGQPLPTWYATAAAALLGLGGHFANVLPDLTADRATGVAGLPQRLGARWGAGAVRGAALVLLLSASVLLLVASRFHWIAVAGMAVACVFAVMGAVGTGKVPFAAAFGIAAVDVVLLVVLGYVGGGGYAQI